MSYKINHHPDCATLMSYASGTLPEAFRVIVAAHIAMCEHCQAEIALMHDIGGALLENTQSVDLGSSAIDDVMKRFDELYMTDNSYPNLEQKQQTSSILADVQSHETSSSRILPEAVSKVLNLKDEDINWRFMAPGMRYHKLPLSEDTSGDLRLLKITPGYSLPEHGHGGSEMTLVLQGSYKDEFGAYSAGDIQDVDSEIEHQPIITGHQECICLVAFEQQANFKGLGPKILQPLIGM